MFKMRHFPISLNDNFFLKQGYTLTSLKSQGNKELKHTHLKRSHFTDGREQSFKATEWFWCLAIWKLSGLVILIKLFSSWFCLYCSCLFVGLFAGREHRGFPLSPQSLAQAPGLLASIWTTEPSCCPSPRLRQSLAGEFSLALKLPT
jgi:hypothetical protein